MEGEPGDRRPRAAPPGHRLPPRVAFAGVFSFDCFDSHHKQLRPVLSGGRCRVWVFAAKIINMLFLCGKPDAFDNQNAALSRKRAGTTYGACPGSVAPVGGAREATSFRAR